MAKQTNKPTQKKSNLTADQYQATLKQLAEAEAGLKEKENQVKELKKLADSHKKEHLADDVKKEVDKVVKALCSNKIIEQYSILVKSSGSKTNWAISLSVPGGKKKKKTTTSKRTRGDWNPSLKNDFIKQLKKGEFYDKAMLKVLCQESGVSLIKMLNDKVVKVVNNEASKQWKQQYKKGNKVTVYQLL